MMRYLLLLLLFPVADGFGQLDDSDTLPARLDLTLKGNLLTGNLERLLVIGGGDLYLNGKSFSVGSHTTYQYGNFGDLATERDLFSRNFIYLRRDSRIYPFLMGWVETNRRRRFDWRWQTGIGFTVRALKTKDHLLKFSGMISREETSYLTNLYNQPEFNGIRNVDIWRLTARAQGSHRFDNWQFRYEGWVQFATGRLDLNRTFGNLSIERLIGKGMSFGIAVNHYREQLVLIGVEESDLFMNVAFRWSTLKV